MTARRASKRRIVLAWGVHLYTALGLLAAGGMVLLIVAGDPDSLRQAFMLMAVATIIDATDGTLARLVGVKEVLPWFDGRRLDDLIDFQTYTCLPLLLLWRAGIPAPGEFGWLVLPLLASAYGFCQVSIKTEDGYFLGFPSYWNLVAFYLYALQPIPAWLSAGLLTGFAILTFLPTRYLYPSQNRSRLNHFTTCVGAAWAVLLLWMLGANALTLPLVFLSLLFPIFYLTASWGISYAHWRKRPRVPAPVATLS